MNKVEHHKQICKQLNAVYKRKNEAYGDSFTDTYKKLGIISAVTRISDKFNRMCNLATHPEIDKGDEALDDTLLDMANYCIMTYMAIHDEETAVPEDYEYHQMTITELLNEMIDLAEWV